MKTNHINSSWGNSIKTYPKIYRPENTKEIIKIIKKKKNFTIQGNGRSYGDVSLNFQNLIKTEKLTKILNFDKKNGIIEVESGLLLVDLLKTILPFGWFIPVTPGTKYVSIGGMVANNVHGKNVKKNQLKYYIKQIKLLNLQGKIVTSSNKKNKKLFDLTVGGFGLTGIILSVKISLKKVFSNLIEQKIVEFKNYKEFYKAYSKNSQYEYAVSWIDSFNKDYICGLHFFGKHSRTKEYVETKFKDSKIPFYTLAFLKIVLANYFLNKLVNSIFRKYKSIFFKKICTINDFFYPQDKFVDWNKVYGKRGFFELQILVSNKKFEKFLAEVSFFLKEKSFFSSFVIIKKISEQGKYLNFFGNGFSISFDFLIKKKTNNLVIFFNKMIKKYNLNVNLSKDLITNKSNVNYLKRYKMFKKNILYLDRKRKLQSIFSKRLGL